MTKNTNYGEQVADLIEAAFQKLGDGLALDPGSAQRKNLVEEARLQVAAARALATLGAAYEARAHGLLQLAALESVGGEAPDPEIARDAYGAAALMLGLVEDEDNSSTVEALFAAGLLDEAKDAELGDLNG